MSDKTKAVNLTEDEITSVIQTYGYKLGAKNYTDSDVDRINYLNKRLKTFNETDEKIITTQVPKSETSMAGWSTNNG